MNNRPLYIYTPIILLTLIVSFFLKFDISNGGSSRDFFYHWEYIVALNKDISILFEYNHSSERAFSQHYPLHHLVISRFDFLSTNPKFYLNFYFIFSLLLPILFYYCLENRFPEIEKKKKIFLSLIIYFLPNYQSSAIWGNSHISSLFFFLGSIYFLNKLEKIGEKINLNIFFIVLFMACAAYIRQYYIIFFPYLFLIILIKTKLKNIIFFSLLSIVLSIPGFFFFINNPILLGGLLGDYTNFKSSILIILSIVFVYLFPFFISDLRYNIFKSLELLRNKKFSIFFILSTAFFIYVLINFNYNGYLGGGFFYKISQILTGNNLLFFTTAFSGMFLCFYFFRKKIDDIFLITIISTSFSSGYAIFQKYFEPMILIIIFLLINKDLIKKVFKFNTHIIFFYFSLYWVTYFMYSASMIKKVNILLPQVGIIGNYFK
jgi:hypothetical protein